MLTFLLRLCATAQHLLEQCGCEHRQGLSGVARSSEPLTGPPDPCPIHD